MNRPVLASPSAPWPTMPVASGAGRARELLAFLCCVLMVLIFSYGWQTQTVQRLNIQAGFLPAYVKAAVLCAGSLGNVASAA